MNAEVQQELLDRAIADAIREGVKQHLLSSYKSPLEKLINDTIANSSGGISSLLAESIKSCVTNEEFREEIKSAVRQTLAKTLVQRFGGELEKQVNILKSDPATRARITLAIEDIVAQKWT